MWHRRTTMKRKKKGERFPPKIAAKAEKASLDLIYGNRTIHVGDLLMAHHNDQEVNWKWHSWHPASVFTAPRQSLAVLFRQLMTSGSKVVVVVLELDKATTAGDGDTRRRKRQLNQNIVAVGHVDSIVLFGKVKSFLNFSSVQKGLNCGQ
ncbi:unnamed protein product [Lactuca saligna]|uniref:Uncharacterized protein n=1 Tax=Lactuca saligna TaxID=75948 RepID=A0AA35YW33_LACSI|nr:unnamed protein product [Lactuca saligna]